MIRALSSIPLFLGAILTLSPASAQDFRPIFSRISPSTGRAVIVERDGKRIATDTQDRVIYVDMKPFEQRWRWASVTKQVLAVLVMQEVEKGKIRLDAPLADYFPLFRGPTSKTITVRQLLRHQSGLPNPDETAQGVSGIPTFYEKYGLEDAAAGFCAGEPKSEPGGNWAYNNCDFIVLGGLLEAVTGSSIDELIKKRIARPLKLRSLVFAGIEDGTGSVKDKEEAAVRLIRYGASGALVGKPSDLLKFDRALMSGKLLKDATRAEMWDGQPDLGFIALGQWVFEAPLKGCAKPLKIVERRGAIGGVQVRNFMIPELGIGAVAFVDNAEFDFGEIWQGVGFSHDLLAAAACQ